MNACLQTADKMEETNKDCQRLHANIAEVNSQLQLETKPLTDLKSSPHSSERPADLCRESDDCAAPSFGVTNPDINSSTNTVSTPVIAVNQCVDVTGSKPEVNNMDESRSAGELGQAVSKVSVSLSADIIKVVITSQQYSYVTNYYYNN